MQADTESSGRKTRLLLICLLAMAAVVRLWNMGVPSLWADELYSVSFARVPTELLWGDWMARETNPPLSYTLLKGWVALFGEQDGALRMLYVLGGLGALGGLFLFTRALHSTRAALVAVGLGAIAAQQIAFSQEVRGYIFGALFASLTLLSLVRLTDIWKQPLTGWRSGIGWLALYVGSAAAAFHTHTTLVILPLLANACMAWIWIWRTPRAPRAAIGWLAANLVLLALCLWWGLMTVRRVQEGADTVGWVPEPTLTDVVAIMSHIVATRSFEFANLLFAAAFGGVMLWGLRQMSLERRVIVVGIGAGAPILLVAASLLQPVFLERTVFWTQVTYFAALAIGLVSLPWPRWRAAAVALVAFVLLADSAVWTFTAYREPWREIARVLRTEATAQDVVVLYSADAGVNLDHYCRIDGCGDARWIAIDAPNANTVLPEYFRGELVAPDRIGENLAGVKRIWALRRVKEDPTTVLPPVASLQIPNALEGGADARIALSIWKPTRTR